MPMPSRSDITTDERGGGRRPASATAPATPVALPPSAWARRLGAEAFGTFALVFVAVGADAMASVTGGAITPAARAVAPALMVAGLIYALGDRSGAHLNPAVTFAFTLKRLFPARWLPLYWAAQLAGAFVAAGAVAVLFEGSRAGVSTPHVADGTAVALEAILTLLLVTVILGTADRYRIVGHEAALAVGGTIALCGLIALPVEGASMNPARSIAPAVMTGQVGSLWIYMVGPAIGATLAVVLAWFLHGDTETDAKATEAARGESVPGETGRRTTGRSARATAATGPTPGRRGGRRPDPAIERPRVS
jgi:aquaporin Z